MAERIKSDLQKTLEKEGWTLEENVDPQIILEGRGLSFELDETDSEVRSVYIEKGFSEVLVTNAYGDLGEILPGYRAVYVR